MIARRVFFGVLSYLGMAWPRPDRTQLRVEIEKHHEAAFDGDDGMFVVKATIPGWLLHSHPRMVARQVHDDVLNGYVLDAATNRQRQRFGYELLPEGVKVDDLKDFYPKQRAQRS